MPAVLGARRMGDRRQGIAATSGGDDDLAPHVPLLQVGDCLRRVRQGEGALQDRRELAPLHELCQRLERGGALAGEERREPLAGPGGEHGGTELSLYAAEPAAAS